MSNSNVKWQRTDTPSVWVGEAPGFNAATDPTVTILGGVHGDEQTGIQVVKDSLESLNLDRGRVFLGLGNTKAITMNKRATVPGQNLNREFKELDPKYADMDPKDWPEEVRRAQELLPVLRDSNALLDLHDFTNPKGPIFMVTEPRGFKTARAIGAPVISSGWSEAEPGGSDYFMETLERTGICYELGDKTKPAENLERGHGAVARFLISQGMFEGQLPPLFAERGEPRYIFNERAFKRMTDHYELLLPEDTLTFDPLKEGQPIANLDGRTITAQQGQVIIFPTKPKDAPVGTEAFSVGREFTPAV